MRLLLRRHSYTPTETEGVLTVGDTQLVTIERPWVPGPDLGGLPFTSCVPDGEYALSPWVRPNGNAEVYILENPELGVCKEAQDRPAQKGRYLILIHVGNWVTDVIGCIAPGLSGGFMVNPKDKRMSKAVLGSAGAMQRLQTRLGRSEIHQLVIAPVLGAKGVI